MVMRHIPPLAAVRVFEAAARHGNFTKAAEELGMTQAAVSYQIKVLEERLQTKLFYRANRQVTLTPTGARIAPLISKAFDNLDDAFSMARTESEAVLSISCPNTFAINWLSIRLGGFQVQHPDIAVRLSTNNQIIDFAREDVDVAIRNSAKPWPGLVSHFLMREPIAVFASPEFIARHPKVQTAADVMKLPRLTMDDEWWESWFEQLTGDTVTPAITGPRGIGSDSQVLDGNATLAGQGVGILNPALWRNDIAAGRLVQLLPNIAFDHRHFWLVYPEHSRNTVKIRAFRDWILAEMARDALRDTDGLYTTPVL